MDDMPPPEMNVYKEIYALKVALNDLRLDVIDIATRMLASRDLATDGDGPIDHAPPFTVEEVQAQRERLLPSASVGMMLDHLLRLMTLDETVQRQRLLDPTTGDVHREPGDPQ